MPQIILIFKKFFSCQVQWHRPLTSCIPEAERGGSQAQSLPEQFNKRLSPNESLSVAVAYGGTVVWHQWGRIKPQYRSLALSSESPVGHRSVLKQVCAGHCAPGVSFSWSELTCHDVACLCRGQAPAHSENHPSRCLLWGLWASSLDSHSSQTSGSWHFVCFSP